MGRGGHFTVKEAREYLKNDEPFARKGGKNTPTNFLDSTKIPMNHLDSAKIPMNHQESIPATNIIEEEIVLTLTKTAEE